MGPSPTAQISALIMAGGAATRMGGIDKTLLEVDGVPLIRRVLDVIEPLFEDVVIAAGSPDRYPELSAVRVVPDRVRGIGPISGLQAGLAGNRNDWTFVVAADMPYLSPDLVRRVCARVADPFEAIVPRHRGLREPLHAAYHKRILPRVDRLIAAGDSKILNLLDQANVRYLEVTEPETRHLLNINRPADLDPRNKP